MGEKIWSAFTGIKNFTLVINIIENPNLQDRLFISASGIRSFALFPQRDVINIIHAIDDKWTIFFYDLLDEGLEKDIALNLEFLFTHFAQNNINIKLSALMKAP